MNKNFSKTTVLLLALAMAMLPAKKLSAQINPSPLAKSGSGFILTYGQKKFTVTSQTLASWQSDQILPANPILNLRPAIFTDLLQLSIGGSSAKTDTAKNVHYNIEKLYTYIKNLSGQITATATEHSLQIDNNQATAFTPPQTGISLDVFNSTLNALNGLETSATSSELTVLKQEPKTFLGDLNNLGINELIGEGVSSFKGSPKNRIWNIGIGVKKMTGIIIPQGAEFSFDNALGPVTKAEGYLPELVILSDKTVPEDGGGLCQVSTTMFRAVMPAGLPVTARINHAYAVSYYSPQGTDATIYPGSADLKFINNTPGAILIWPYFKDKTTLIFDFYGSSDGRKVVLHTPIITDRLPDGSMKASWQRDIIKDGVTATKIFKSVYQPPALFHKTETFISATGAPESIKIPAQKSN